MPVGALANGLTLNVYGDGADPILSTNTNDPITIALRQVNQMPALEVASGSGHVYVDLGLPSDQQWLHVRQLFRILFLI